jgi:hypothetical protein
MDKIIIPKSVSYFTDNEKHEVIKDYLTAGRSKDYIWRKYTGKADHGRLLRWMRDLGYDEGNPGLNRRIVSENNLMPKKKVPIDSEEQAFETLQLKKRIQELEKQLRDAELKAIAFSTMVDIAEREFKVPIRKKFNTKP